MVGTLSTRHHPIISDLRAGFLHFLPVGIVIAGYAVVFGVLAAGSGLAVAEACLMSLTVFAGASQFIALPMLEKGASLGALAAMALVVNLRHLLYGLSIGRKYAGTGTAVLLAVSFGIVDETYAFHTLGPGRSIRSIPYFAGTALCAYFVWNTGTLAGALIGGLLVSLPAEGLDFAMLAVFISMVGSSVRSRADWSVIALALLAAPVVQKLAGGYWHLFAAGLLAPLAAALLLKGSGHEV